MLDRESTFADEEIAELLKTKFVPVAIDQWYTRKQDDAEGKFYQAIAKQGPRNDMNSTTQGLYVCDAGGKLIGYNNNRHAQPIKKILREAVARKAKSQDANLIKATKADADYSREIPKGATTVRVNTKILGGYEKTEDQYLAIFQKSIARDNLWILAKEKQELHGGKFPESLARRIARFHLIDNTRGEPRMWTDAEVRSLKIKLDAEGNLTGSARIESKDSETGFDLAIRGVIKTSENKIERFDLVAKGMYFGEGPYTKNAPKGKFPLAVAFRLADGTDIADPIAPQGTKGWIEPYLNNR